MKRIGLGLCLAALFAVGTTGAQAQNCPVDPVTGNAVARLVSPTDGTTLIPENPSVTPLPAVDPVSGLAGAVTFAWCNANADYFLTVESVPGAHDIFNAFAGGVGPGAGVVSVTLGPACNIPSATNPTTGCIPTRGETIFVTLFTQKRGATLAPSPFFYTFTAANTAGPPAPIIALGPISPTKQTSATFVFSDADPTATFLCALDGSAPGAFAPCASGHSYGPGLAEGSHTFFVKAHNQGGDSALVAFTWSIDLTAPDAIIDSMPLDLTNQTTATFAFHATEPGSTLACSLDGAAFAGCSSPVAAPGLTDGLHSFAVRATDLAGNTGSAASFSWSIDTQAPDTVIDSAPPLVTDSNTATFTFHALGASAVTCQLDAQGAVACASGTVTYAGLGAGSHTFTVQATDAAGNTGPAATFSWAVVTPAPPTTPSATPPTTPSATPPTTQSSSSGGGGGCTINASAGFDPMLIGLAGLSLVSLIWRRIKKG